MKNKLSVSLLGMILATTTGVARGQDQSPPPPGDGTFSLTKSGAGSMMLVGPSMPVARAKEKASYLGVSISPASPELRSQVGLLAGFGLVVNSVESGSPAARAGVKQYDVLTKFDDQQLVDAEQLTALVRSKQSGDSVDLSIIRQGKPLTLTAKIVLGEVPAEFKFAAEVNGLSMPGLILENQNDAPGQSRRMSVKVAPFAAAPDTPWKTGGSVRILQDADSGQSFIFMTNQGLTHLTISDRDNHSLFDGPINTPEQLNRIPTEINKRLQEVLKKNNLTMEDIVSKGKSDAPPGAEPPTPGI